MIRSKLIERLATLTTVAAITIGCAAPVDKRPILIIPTPATAKIPQPTPEPLPAPQLPFCRVDYATSRTFEGDHQSDATIPIFRLTPPEGAVNVETNFETYGDNERPSVTMRYTLDETTYIVGFNQTCTLVGIAVEPPTTPPTTR